MLQCTDGQLSTNMTHSWVLFFGLRDKLQSIILLHQLFL